ncbi:hypothetical protein KSP40_PGU015669 [Platanthera guangdongensis]|uniref:Uncharacterized protein n=1 Tax=Platanthera guangdongensis TaxID=2320717 RepID=A0ABR2MTS1_9ASPA
MDEHEVYGGEIPDVADMDGDEEMPIANADNPSSKEEVVSCQSLEEMKKRLKEMEEEASALREMQTRVEKEMGVAQGILPSISLPSRVYDSC